MVNENPEGKIVAGCSIFLNIIIFGVKVYLAILVGSLALLSDSIHSISDSASSFAVYVGLKISEKPADEQHPYGHGRAEIVAILVVGIILVITALAFLIEGVESLVLRVSPLDYIPTRFYLYIFLTALAKGVMGEISYFIGSKTGTGSLKADAWHHRGDAITTMLVIGSMYGSEIGVWYLDPMAAVLIALLLGYIGISYVKKSVDRLLGTTPSSDLIEEIKKTSSDIDGVEEVHNIKVHDYGHDKSISLHMRSEDGTLNSAHEASHLLKDKLEDKFGSTCEIHFDPVSIPREEIYSLIKKRAKEYEDTIEVHRLEITESKDKILISFHLIVDQDLTIRESHEIATTFEKDVLDEAKSLFKADIEIRTHIEPDNESLLNS